MSGRRRARHRAGVPYPIAPNVLDRQFGIDAAPALNRMWIGDITYLATLEGWWYHAVVLDLRSRRVIGWAMRHTLEGAITRDALAMALQDRRPRGRLPLAVGLSKSVCGPLLPSAAHGKRHDPHHESHRRLLGQRGGREPFCDSQTRAGRSRSLAHPRRGSRHHLEEWVGPHVV